MNRSTAESPSGPTRTSQARVRSGLGGVARQLADRRGKAFHVDPHATQAGIGDDPEAEGKTPVDLGPQDALDEGRQLHFLPPGGRGQVERPLDLAGEDEGALHLVTHRSRFRAERALRRRPAKGEDVDGSPQIAEERTRHAGQGLQPPRRRSSSTRSRARARRRSSSSAWRCSRALRPMPGRPRGPRRPCDPRGRRRRAGGRRARRRGATLPRSRAPARPGRAPIRADPRGRGRPGRRRARTRRGPGAPRGRHQAEAIGEATADPVGHGEEREQGVAAADPVVVGQHRLGRRQGTRDQAQGSEQDGPEATRAFVAREREQEEPEKEQEDGGRPEARARVGTTASAATSTGRGPRRAAPKAGTMNPMNRRSIRGSRPFRGSSPAARANTQRACPRSQRTAEAATRPRKRRSAPLSRTRLAKEDDGRPGGGHREGGLAQQGGPTGAAGREVGEEEGRGQEEARGRPRRGVNRRPARKRPGPTATSWKRRTDARGVVHGLLQGPQRRPRGRPGPPPARRLRRSP